MANGKTGTSKSFRISVKLPVEEGVKEEVIICEPVLKEKSKIIEVRYPIPYALDVEKNEVTGLPTWYVWEKFLDCLSKDISKIGSQL